MKECNCKKLAEYNEFPQKWIYPNCCPCRDKHNQAFGHCSICGGGACAYVGGAPIFRSPKEWMNQEKQTKKDFLLKQLEELL